MSQPAASNYVCPYCTQAVNVSPSHEPAEWVCPHCGETFVIGESSEPRDHPDNRDDELNAARIRQLAHARKSAYRARSFCLIGALFCAVGFVQLTINLVADIVRGEMDWLTVVLAAIDALMLWAAVYLLRKAQQLFAEAKRTTIPPIDHPPDFSSLDDGSRRWKDLDELR